VTAREIPVSRWTLRVSIQRETEKMAIVCEAFKDHVRHLVEHRLFILNNCQECRADGERQFTRSKPFTHHNPHMSKYLEYVRPRLEALRNGEDSVDARIWLRNFRVALNRRISSHIPGRSGRKFCESYLERLKQWENRRPEYYQLGRGNKHVVDAEYLRRFAARGASCLT
jgi:hypothetical protein